jgi:hypothetical protein
MALNIYTLNIERASGIDYSTPPRQRLQAMERIEREVRRFMDQL